MTAFERCIEALGQEGQALSKDETKQIFQKFTSDFPITNYARIEWEAVEKKYEITDVGALPPLFERDIPFYVLWNSDTLPIIQSNMHAIANAIHYVTAVSFGTWLYSPDLKVVVEFYDDGTVFFGKM
ncbi:hypothetical protein [Ectobacillus panaciterrae]|uniref:CDI toxin immunity protein n=1 Tax=Ectobacillus panaciterrae TaxID=363872 RepID=UPI00048EB193|nr:hypothetical protein [Ectobacillus panaciterrae]